jgi:hypothetical protein
MDEPPPEEVAAAWSAAMRSGDYAQAWHQTDRIELARRERERLPGFVRGPQHLRWNGSPFTGRSVLVWCEHGLGDTLQFIRFVPALSALAREVHLMVQPPLVHLLSGAPGLGTVHDGWSDRPLPACEVEIEVMELAYAFRPTTDTLPPPFRELQLPADAPFEAPTGSRNVGLLWAASDWDTSRSLPLAQLRPLTEVPGLRFFSLQQGEAASEPQVAHLGIVALSPRTVDIGAAAAAMCALDLIISVDGMAAHLAGSLGRPTWVLLKHDADWRWMLGREDSPWYPGMRLFRQAKAGDWESVVNQVRQALQAFV